MSSPGRPSKSNNLLPTHSSPIGARNNGSSSDSDSDGGVTLPPSSQHPPPTPLPSSARAALSNTAEHPNSPLRGLDITRSPVPEQQNPANRPNQLQVTVDTFGSPKMQTRLGAQPAYNAATTNPHSTSTPGDKVGKVDEEEEIETNPFPGEWPGACRRFVGAAGIQTNPFASHGPSSFGRGATGGQDIETNPFVSQGAPFGSRTVADDGRPDRDHAAIQRATERSRELQALLGLVPPPSPTQQVEPAMDTEKAVGPAKGGRGGRGHGRGAGRD